MHRTTLALATLLAATAIASAQTSTAPIGGAPIGSDPIGADEGSIGSGALVAPGRVVGSGRVGVPADADTGARIGAAITKPPSRVRGYVSRQRGPSVTTTRPVVIGQPVPGAVDLYQVPNSSYRYGVVDGRRVIVEPGSRRVIDVVD
jgi:hypothetical protein